MTTAQPVEQELVAEEGGWPDMELLVLDRLGAVLDDDGTPLAPLLNDRGEVVREGRVDTETGDPIPEAFIRVGEQSGRAGISPSGVTGYSTVLVEVYGPRRASAKRMMREATELLLALDRGGAHRRVLVDACYNASAEAPEDDRDEDDRRRSALWTLEYRRHRGAAVYL